MTLGRNKTNYGMSRGCFMDHETVYHIESARCECWCVYVFVEFYIISESFKLRDSPNID